MARVAPVFGTSAAIPVIFGLGAGEEPSSIQLAGMATAIVGVVLVSIRGSTEEPRGERTGLALALAVLTTIGIGLTLVGLDRVSAYDPYWAVLLARVSGVVLLVGLAAAIAREGLALAGVALLPLVGIGLIDVAANVSWSVASTEGLLSLVAVLGSVFPAVTVMLSLVFLREPLTMIQAPGVAVTLAGSAMIAA
jgi:drug/metabolite transporter (DMT)-like permease